MTSLRRSTKTSGYQTNSCERCEGPLAAHDGHYHSGVDGRGYAIDICCTCKGHKGSAPAEQPEYRTSLKVTDTPREFAPSVVEPEVLVGVEAVRTEERVYAVAKALGKFKVVDIERKCHLDWLKARDIVRNDGRYEQLSKQLWQVKGN